MSPKTRLNALIVALVAAVVCVLSTLYLYGLADAKFRDMTEIARISAEQVKIYLLQRVREYSLQQPATNLEESKLIWRQMVRNDAALTNFLIGTIASSSSVVEILVADEQGIAVAGSNQARIDKRVMPIADLGAWSRRGAIKKLWELRAGSRDFELKVPLGVAGEDQPVFTIHVMLSTVLLRNAVMPQVRNLAAISLLCIIISAVVAGLLSNLAARPLVKVSAMIDSIVSERQRRSPASGSPRSRAGHAPVQTLTAGRTDSRGRGGYIRSARQRGADAGAAGRCGLAV